MLPPQILGVYRQYKEDTDSVASWLASTAKSCGFPADLLASQTWDVPEKIHPRTARLKGKARKQTLNANPGTASSGEKASKYIVALKDFLSLANFIAGSKKPVVSVPPAFVTTIDRLIKLRSDFGDMMEPHGSAPDAEADSKHVFFVGVLEAVREALQPRMPRMPETPPTAEGSKDPAQDLGSRFASLSMDEPSQAFIDSFLEAPPQRPKPRKEDTVAYEAEPQTSLDDITFAYLALVSDLNRIRSRISWIWSGASEEGEAFDLAAASVATNVAVSLARGLIEDITPILESYDKGIGGLIQVSFLAVGMGKGYSIDEIMPGNGVPFNLELYDIANSIYAVPHSLLRGCLDVLQPGAIPLYREGMFGTYDPNSDRDAKSGTEKFQEDKILILEFFTEQMTVIRAIPDYPVEDEFMRGMRELDRTRKVSFSVVFAAQIFLDIHHILRGATEHYYDKFASEINLMEGLLKRHLEFHEDLKVETWPASNDRMFKHLRDSIKDMGKDLLYEVKTEQWRRHGEAAPDMEKNRIMLYSPVLSGLYLFDLRTKLHEAGTAVADAWGSVVCSAHLYNALQSTKSVIDPWKDMDVAITLLDEASFWVGGERPRTPADCFKKFCLQMGVSASNFTPNRRRDNAIGSRSGPRGIKAGIPVSSMFVEKFATGSDLEWTTERVKDIVARTKFVLKEFSDGTFELEKITDPQALKAKEQERVTTEKKNKNKKKKKKSKADGGSIEPGIDPAGLIKDLAMALQSETMEMAFPYLLLHRWCWMLLRKVKDGCNPVLTELHTPDYIEQENKLPWAVGWILGDAAGMNNGVPDGRPLAAAAEVMNDLVASGAGDFILKICESQLGMAVAFEEEAD